MKKVLLILLAVVMTLTPVLSVYATDNNTRQIFRNEDYIYEVMDSGDIVIHYYIGFDENVIVPSHIEGKAVTTIGERAFYGTKIKSLVISEGITTIMDEAFFYCYELENATLPSSLKTVGLGVFRDCMKLQRVVFTDKKGALGLYMFYGCVSLEDITLPSDIQEIPVGMFGYCKSLREIELPERLYYINNYAFYSSGLVSVELPSFLQSIDEKAFAQSKQLESVSGYNPLESMVIIAPDAFEGCITKGPDEYTNQVTPVPPTDPTETTDCVPDCTIPEVPSPTEPVPGTEVPDLPPPTEPDPTEAPGFTDGFCTSDEVMTDAPGVDDSTFTSDGYYMGSASGFLEMEEDVISSAHYYVEKNRQELLSLAWNVRMLGDSNMDYSVNIKDATNIQRYVAGLVAENDDSFDYKNSDANTDGQVNIKDATAIQKYVAGLVTSLC